MRVGAIVSAQVMARVGRSWRGWGRGRTAGLGHIKRIGVRVHALWNGNTFERFVVDRCAQAIIEDILLGVIANEMEFWWFAVMLKDCLMRPSGL